MFSFRSANNTKIYEKQQQLRPNPIINNNITFPLFFRKMNVTVVPTVVPTVKPPEMKIKWGEPTWNLFHTLAQKIIPEDFFSMRTDIFELIRNICYNLPCPDCANHARNYINSVNFNNITNNNHLKELFFAFHNNVNARKEFPIFPRDQLESRYDVMDIHNVVNLFLMHFRDKHKSTRMLADDLFRAKLANKIEKWFIENIHHFQL
jgi:hypothetical protein